MSVHSHTSNTMNHSPNDSGHSQLASNIINVRLQSYIEHAADESFHKRSCPLLALRRLTVQNKYIKEGQTHNVPQVFPQEFLTFCAPSAGSGWAGLTSGCAGSCGTCSSITAENSWVLSLEYSSTFRVCTDLERECDESASPIYWKPLGTCRLSFGA